MADDYQFGFLYVKHLDEDNQTILNIREIKYIPRIGCSIYAVKELKRGSIIFGGGSPCNMLCLWNYAVLPLLNPQCWEDLTPSYIWDFVPVPD